MTTLKATVGAEFSGSGVGVNRWDKTRLPLALATENTTFAGDYCNQSAWIGRGKAISQVG
jgi:hypothetical protein